MYQSKYNQLPGTTLARALRSAHKCHDAIKRRNPRRRPYVRAKYFKNDKVFLTLYWSHLLQKDRKEQLRRARLYKAALDLIRNTSCTPSVTIDAAKSDIYLYRFYGITKDGVDFCVQIKQNHESGRKDLISTFPVNHKK